MSPLLLFFACWVGLAMAWSAPPIDLENAETLFEHFILQYGRRYADDNEKEARFQIFKDNLRIANEKNKHSNSAVYGITQFSDLTPEEFLRYHTGLVIPENLDYNNTLTDDDVPYAGAPDSFDWRDKNVVTPVKDQKNCQGCYAFSATGNIESLYAIKYKRQIQISEQQVIDCDKIDDGCNGGFPWNVFKSLINKGGAMSEEDYPFTEEQGQCHFDASKVKIKLANLQMHTLQSQEKLKELLYQNGPLSIGVDGLGVQHYKRGVLADKDCQGLINHAVLLVGYGTDADTGEQYWLVKNSWGKIFGEEGFFRMHRGEGAVSCGMLTVPVSTAVVA